MPSPFWFRRCQKPETWVYEVLQTPSKCGTHQPGAGISQARRAPEPRKEPKGSPWPKRVRPRVRKESKKAASDSVWTLFGLFSDSKVHSYGTLGLPGPAAPGHPFGLFLVSFRTLLAFRARRARETPVPGRWVRNPSICGTQKEKLRKDKDTQNLRCDLHLLKFAHSATRGADVESYLLVRRD